MNKILKGTIYSLFILVVASCTKPEKEETNGNDNEVYTTFEAVFTDQTGMEPQKKFIFRDLDGIGGNLPSRFDTIQLTANKVYHLNINVLNESVNPIDTISNEIFEEGNVHQFFYTISGGYVSTQYLDSDTNNPALPIGLYSKWTVGSAVENISARFVLKHYQNGTKNGLISSGSTDIDLNFPMRIR